MVMFVNTARFLRGKNSMCALTLDHKESSAHTVRELRSVCSLQKKCCTFRVVAALHLSQTDVSIQLRWSKWGSPELKSHWASICPSELPVLLAQTLENITEELVSVVLMSMVPSVQFSFQKSVQLSDGHLKEENTKQVAMYTLL